MSENRQGSASRSTKETQIRAAICLDGTGAAQVSTGVPFFDHMLDQLAKHGLFDITVEAKGDIEVDAHHTVEDVGIVLGDAFSQALGDAAGIRRFASATVPMDEALVQAVVDISGRPGFFGGLDLPPATLGNFDAQLADEFFRAFATHARLTLHIRKLAGHNLHHIIEAAFKALAHALDEATCVDPRRAGQTPSTKGAL